MLEFARDRDAYRAMLREQLGGFNVWLLDYCLTSKVIQTAQGLTVLQESPIPCEPETAGARPGRTQGVG